MKERGGETRSHRGVVPSVPADDGFAADLFAAGGEMGALMREVDWSKTGLGPVNTWPRSLKTMLGVVLGSRFPMLLWWGPDLLHLYNDAYRPILRDKHPASLGAPAAEVWQEVWHVAGPLARSVQEGGPATWMEDLQLFINSGAMSEETYFTFSYSPVPGDDGRLGGLLNTVQETTAKVQGERQIRMLHDLAARAAEARSEQEAYRVAMEVLSSNDLDLPFALLYLANDEDNSARLAGVAGWNDYDGPAKQARVPIADKSNGTGWPLSEVIRTGREVIVDDVSTRFGALPLGRWQARPERAIVLPVGRVGRSTAVAFLVAGISPHRQMDDRYRRFFAATADQVGSVIVHARAYETETRRVDELAEIDRAKTAFFSNVSHEFRTPLTLILGHIEDAIRSTNAPSTGTLQGESLDAVYRNALRLLRLVNSLLDFARIESGRFRLSFVPTNLSRLTADLASTFRSLVEQAGIELVVDCPPLPDPVFVDPRQWEKIVLNLLSNAFKFTFEGRIVVTLRQLGTQVALSVTDTGTGIPTTELPRMFERFHRVEGARGRSFEGTGIGLSLVRDLVNLHGGSVRVTSNLGRGSTFEVVIPAGSAHLPAGEIAREQKPSDASPSHALAPTPYLLEASRWTNGPEGNAVDSASAPVAVAPGAFEGAAAHARILIVDDNADMRAYLARLLAPHWQVEVALDGESALTRACIDPPDLVLSDVMMPGLDGLGLLRQLRANGRTRTVPVILLSARAGEEPAIEGLATGADDYVVKPFSANELIARVRTHLEMAQARRQWTDKLAALNQDLDRSLVQARAAREEALAASRAKSQFLAAVSHEIRTPLNAVLGFADLLADGDLTDRQRDFVNVIRTSGSHLLNVINDILDFSKLQAGHFALSPRPFALRPTLESALSFVAGNAAEKGLELAYVMDADVPAGLDADEGRVRQILINYLSNAVKFTKTGEIVLHVRSRPLDGDGRHEFHFSVRDTGMGIAPGNMDRLFREFSQADATVGARFGGTGLGLTICKRLAELHGGRVWAESTEGVGSVFHVAIPAFARADVGEVPARRASALRGLRVLVVDDNATNLEILRRQCESWGMTVRALGHAEHALACLERGERFDLIITDHDMPEMDGIALAKRIRALPSGTGAPIILFSSVGGAAQAARQAGADIAAVLTKPIRQSDLHDRVAEVVHHRHATGQTPKESPEASVAFAALDILLVDDNTVNRKVGVAILERIGYRADVASSGSEALLALERKPYDVVLMDIQMPDMDGVETTRRIRALRSLPRQPRIIAMTAHALEGDRETYLGAGLDGYLTKPIVRKDLADVLREATRMPKT